MANEAEARNHGLGALTQWGHEVDVGRCGGKTTLGLEPGGLPVNP